MKRAIYLIIRMLFLSGSLFQTVLSSANNIKAENDPVKVYAAPGVLDLTKSWAEKYNSLYPASVIKVTNLDDENNVSDLMKNGTAVFTTADDLAKIKGPVWNVIVGRDVVVPVLSAKNPLKNEIDSKGISTAALTELLSSGNSGNWNSLVKGAGDHKAKLILTADESVKKALTGFFRIDAAKFRFTEVGNKNDLITALQDDPYAIGFCRFAELTDPATGELSTGIALLPLDRNGNGMMDYNEKIFGTANEFSRGVWIGKYPRALVTNIYAVAARKPANAEDVKFIKWVLSDGQKYLAGSGFSDLIASERTAAIDGLNAAIPQPEIYAGTNSLVRVLLFIITTVVLAGLIVTTVARKKKRSKTAVILNPNTTHRILERESLAIPGGIYFDKTHTWAFMEESGTVRIGIDDFLQHVTGKITKVKMKQEGSRVKKGETILSIIQNGKQLNLYAPVSGTIVEHNAVLEADSSYLNTSPYQNGWIYRIEPLNWGRESQLLFMAEKQREFIKKEFIRLKDFLMNALKGDQVYAQLILQDGGEISDAVLSEMGPEVWDDFQTNFIDPSRQVWFYEIF